MASLLGLAGVVVLFVAFGLARRDRPAGGCAGCTGGACPGEDCRDRS